LPPSWCGAFSSVDDLRMPTSVHFASVTRRLKVGRSAKGAAASAAHTGSLAGNWDAYQAYFRRHGAIAVDDFDELTESIELALKVRRAPQGDGVAVIAVSGGEASLVADLAERAQLRLPELAPAALHLEMKVGVPRCAARTPTGSGLPRTWVRSDVIRPAG